MSSDKALENFHQQFSNIERLNLTEVKELYKKIESTDNEELKKKYYDKIILGTEYVVYEYLKNSQIYKLAGRDFDEEDIISSTVEAWIENIRNGTVKNAPSFSRITQTTFSNLVIDKLCVEKARVGIGTGKRLFGSTITCFWISNDDFTNNFVKYYKFKQEKEELSEEDISFFKDELCTIKSDSFEEIITQKFYIGIFDSMTDYLDNVLDEDISATNLKKYADLIYHNVMVESINNDYVDALSIDTNLIQENQKEKLSEACSILTDREEKILNLRYGLDDGQCKTLDEIGQIIGFSRDGVRHIEAKALRKLRHPSRSRELNGFLTD